MEGTEAALISMVDNDPWLSAEIRANDVAVVALYLYTCQGVINMYAGFGNVGSIRIRNYFRGPRTLHFSKFCMALRSTTWFGAGVFLQLFNLRSAFSSSASFPKHLLEVTFIGMFDTCWGIVGFPCIPHVNHGIAQEQFHSFVKMSALQHPHRRG